MPRRLGLPAGNRPGRRSRAVGIVVLVVAAVGLGIGFGHAVDVEDWARPWRQLTERYAGGPADVEPAGGPLPAEAGGAGQPAEASGGTVTANGSAVGTQGDSVPIPSRRPSVDEVQVEVSPVAAGDGGPELAALAEGGDDAAQLAPLFLGRVFVHYAGSDDDIESRERAERVARALEDDGYRISAVRPVSFAIRASSIRYFHDDDRSAASRLRNDLPPPIAERARVMDFTAYEPRPRPGTIELWLADSG